MSQALQGATFHLEHIVPRARGGTTTSQNLALACPGCNLHKAEGVMALDPESARETPLFHPRRDEWSAHFAWDGLEIIAKTPAGRATVGRLELNHPRRLRIREAESRFGLFPPE